MNIPVHCSHVRMAKVADLKPNPRNPNRHPPEQIALLAKNIERLGWRHPVLVSKRSGLVVAGHARIEAARKIGLTEVPVDEQAFGSVAEEMAYLIADNRIAELAERDADAISGLLTELQAGGAVEMDLTGYDAAELERLMTCDTPLKPVAVQKPPRMAWVLVGVPIGEWGKVSPLAEAAAQIEGSIVETTANDGVKED